MSNEPPQRELKGLAPPVEAYGTPISAMRQADLQGYLDHWQMEIGRDKRRGPFDSSENGVDVQLTGADVFWLANQSGRSPIGWLPNLHLEGAQLFQAYLEGADLRGAHLEGANLRLAHLKNALLRDTHLERADLREAHLDEINLRLAHLEGADFRDTHLERADLREAHLEGADLRRAHLEGIDLSGAHLEGADLSTAYLGGADLSAAHLEGANLRLAHLEGADLRDTHLERADLRDAHLEGANLRSAHLEGTDLRAVALDINSVLSDATLDKSSRLGDIQWSGVGVVNLTRINWDSVSTLGDEQNLSILSPATYHESAVRAYRQLAAQLRAQGMSEVADRFAYRAQNRQRIHLLRRGRIPGYFGSLVLAALAGYGYRPGRSILWYVAIIAGFSVLYFNFGLVNGHAFNPTEAIVFSITSFHGRGFFPGGLTLDDPVTVLASIEAVIGLLIEISFIATFTQRFFGAK
jgi:uncharacterized protein YjbI with pentapeptide repeats